MTWSRRNRPFGHVVAVILVLLALKKRLENWFFAAHEEPMSLSCLACNQTDLQRVRRYRLDTSYGREVFGDAWLHMCKMCGLVQMVPRPAPRTVADNYVQDYRRGGLYGSDVADANKFPKDNLFYYNRGLSIAELISPHIDKANPQILDIGAGFGGTHGESGNT